jgi:hypothetical protein
LHLNWRGRRSEAQNERTISGRCTGATPVDQMAQMERDQELRKPAGSWLVNRCTADLRGRWDSHGDGLDALRLMSSRRDRQNALVSEYNPNYL